MTGYTPGDALRYPNDYNAPADVPNDIQALATSTQTALNKRVTNTFTSGGITLDSGWKPNSGTMSGYGHLFVHRVGFVCIARGMALRATALTVEDNQVYSIGTVPAGYRPHVAIRAAMPWVARDTRGVQYMTTQVTIQTSGDVSFVSNVDGTMDVDHWVSLAGIAWIGA